MTSSHCCTLSALLLFLRKVSWILRFAERHCGSDFPNAECQHKGEKSDQNQTHTRKRAVAAATTKQSEVKLIFLIYCRKSLKGKWHWRPIVEVCYYCKRKKVVKAFRDMNHVKTKRQICLICQTKFRMVSNRTPILFREKLFALNGM